MNIKLNQSGICITSMVQHTANALVKYSALALAHLALAATTR
jgi:hypothetical protein